MKTLNVRRCHHSGANYNPCADAGFDETFQELEREVNEHVAEEESEILPQLRYFRTIESHSSVCP
jgi:hypothetical protein